jgi:hypothetical protein
MDSWATLSTPRYIERKILFDLSFEDIIPGLIAEYGD